MNTSTSSVLNGLWQLPGIAGIKDKESRYLSINKGFFELIGIKSTNEIIGKYDKDLPCPAALSAEQFREQDQYVIHQDKELCVLDCHEYANNDSKVLLTRKKPFYDDNKLIVGVAANCFPMEGMYWSKINAILVELDQTYYKTKVKSRTYLINANVKELYLTKREQECLFFTIRGKTAKEIGRILDISAKTASVHIENIKKKLHVHSKSALIEKSLNLNLHHYLPAYLLNKLSIIV